MYPTIEATQPQLRYSNKGLFHASRTQKLTTREGHLAVVQCHNGIVLYAVAVQSEVAADIAKKASLKEKDVTCKWMPKATVIELIQKEIEKLEYADHSGKRWEKLKDTLRLINK